MKCIQLAHDNYDIKQNSKVREKYPLLYQEVLEHDKVSTSSWYSISERAFKEYIKYYNDTQIGYVN